MRTGSAQETGEEQIAEVTVTDINGHETILANFAGKVLLIVNVASRCGFTGQYAELEKLQQAYSSAGFSVLAFPCNQFLHQEPLSNVGILAFAESCYRVTFPIFARIDVRGRSQAPIYAWLARHMKRRPLLLVPWNFTKFLIGADGKVVRRFLPTASFDTIREAIERELEKSQHADL
ncbi:glutathione peroxidase [Legionella geestiana]|uniref:glutathione peroxidase n=1 Tax=Legionella geestiana TaxID=45065 RepID=UPI001092A926|nr:glutathione peroxidase [Legionella geestiana]QDQ39818.1 glutathione peroxidase [Legionella geestiana]